MYADNMIRYMRLTKYICIRGKYSYVYIADAGIGSLDAFLAEIESDMLEDSIPNIS